MNNTTHNRRKGQAAVEYLMNYAWAIALIIIVGIAIFALDVGGLRTSIQSQGDLGFQTGDAAAIQDLEYVFDANSLGHDNVTLTIKNNGDGSITFAQDEITVNFVNGESASASSTLNNCPDGSETVFAGQRLTSCRISNITSPSGLEAGKRATVAFKINYTDDESGLKHEVSKNLTPTAQ
jgi:archaellum component FlaG (FlaF/FlaG flagellin family)